VDSVAIGDKMGRRFGSSLVLVWILFLIFFNHSGADEQDPAVSSSNDRAVLIATANPRITKTQKELIRRVKQMKPSSDGVITQTLLTDTLSLLGAPGTGPFQFKMISRKEKEKELQQALQHYFLNLGKKDLALSPSETRNQNSNGLGLFPRTQPMSIVGAPGASWEGHHVYPGGLITHIDSAMQINLQILEIYGKVYGLKVTSSQKDLLVLAAIWHDCAKAWVLNWKEDGTVTDREGKIAGTGAHHIWSIAEALVRNYHPDFIVTLAGAHDAFTEGEDTYQKGIHYLAAAAILAGVKWEQAGLAERSGGKLDLQKKPQLFPLINHLGDADWVITEQALKNVRPVLDEILKEIPEYSGSSPKKIRTRNWKRNEFLSLQGEIPLYSLLQAGGKQALKKWVLDQL
jgi:hypothetical protein